MSLLMNTLPVTAQGSPGARTEQRPRLLRGSDSKADLEQTKHGGLGKEAAHASSKDPYCRPHGNALPQEPPFHGTWSLDGQKRQVQHPHPRPWSFSSCPGKKESPEGANAFHRVWLVETGQRGRWNKERKKEFYAKQDQELMSKVPHDELFCRGDSNYKFWTHLLEGGIKAGGQKEKLDYSYRGPNTTSDHFYLGRYDSVRHVQRILKTGYKDPVTGESRGLQQDTRPAFDNRLHDDNVRRNEQETQWARDSSLDVLRPSNTRSCPQLGADYVVR